MSEGAARVTIQVSPLLNAAIEAHRAAYAYQQMIWDKWDDKRMEEVRKLDEFHPTSISYENDVFRASECVGTTRTLLSGAAVGKEVFINEWVIKLLFKQKRPPKGFARARRALREALELYDQAHPRVGVLALLRQIEENRKTRKN